MAEEEIEPYCKWRRGLTCDNLEVDRHGFEEDQIRTTPNDRGMFTIRGRRRLDGTLKRWKSLNKEIEIPRGLKKEDITTNFNGGILHVTIPKKNPFLAAFYHLGLKITAGVLTAVAFGMVLAAVIYWKCN
ncbi:uncharacterized protein LOC132162348 [Corylus avellana]|uniref:uncharacterized protein LOC132162348 n=1 Tax=Corylus avellana TaxID=13451 RepID=UPI00286C50A3|nr:uncharacterized protein LOC132162348 [Corylus avellana]